MLVYCRQGTVKCWFNASKVLKDAGLMPARGCKMLVYCRQGAVSSNAGSMPARCCRKPAQLMDVFIIKVSIQNLLTFFNCDRFISLHLAYGALRSFNKYASDGACITDSTRHQDSALI